jgi:hypothetical protein
MVRQIERDDGPEMSLGPSVHRLHLSRRPRAARPDGRAGRAHVDLHKKLAAEGAPHVKTVLQRQIDALVYELYGLTAEGIAVVEG